MSILQPGIESIPSVGRSAARNLSCPVKGNDSILDKFCILAQKGGGSDSDIFKHCTEKSPKIAPFCQSIPSFIPGVSGKGFLDPGNGKGN